MAPKRSRSWFLTIHKEERWGKFITWAKANVDRISYAFVSGIEFTQKDLPHVHAWVHLHNPCTRKAMMKIVRMDARPALGDADDAKNYTRKATTEPLLEFGKPPRPGERTDVREVIDMIKEGKDDAEIYDVSDCAARMTGHISKIRFAYSKVLGKVVRPNIVGQWFWGPTHTGKSHRAFTENPGAIPLDCEGSNFIWFDGYSNEKTIILDELGHVSAKQMKRIVDKWPYRAPVKGSFIWAQWTKVVVCSNYSPEEVFTDPRDCAAILRRFEVIKMDKPYVAV